MWLFLNTLDIENVVDISRVALEKADTPEELFDKIEIFRNVNMVAGGHDPIQDGEFTISKFYEPGSYFRFDHYHTEIYKIKNARHYESRKSEIMSIFLEDSVDREWELINST